MIGDPVRHSLSPVLHNAAFASLGIDWVYVAFPVAAGRGAEAVAAMRTLGIAGLSVTMPHKAAVAGAVDRLTPVAERLGVVNTVSLSAKGGETVGDNTDGDGFVESLRADEGWDPAGKRCLILGAGGAARSVALALADAGAAKVAVLARRHEAAEAVCALAGPAGRVASGPHEVAKADLVVNSTPVGMGSAVHASMPSAAATSDEELPLGVDPEHLGPGQLVADLIYDPPLTPLMAAARRRGALSVNGAGMLLHQAGRQLHSWTGERPPLDAMSVALLAALGTGGGARV